MINVHTRRDPISRWQRFVERSEKLKPKQTAIGGPDHFLSQSRQFLQRFNTFSVLGLVIAAERLGTRHGSLGVDPGKSVELTVLFDLIGIVGRSDEGDGAGQHEQGDSGHSPGFLLANDAIDDDFARNQVCTQF